jgi:hypothetical protein
MTCARALVGTAALAVVLFLGGCAQQPVVGAGEQDTDGTTTSETGGREGDSPSALGFREVHVKLESGVTITCLTALWGDVPLLECDWANASTRPQ